MREKGAPEGLGPVFKTIVEKITPGIFLHFLLLCLIQLGSSVWRDGLGVVLTLPGNNIIANIVADITEMIVAGGS